MVGSNGQSGDGEDLRSLFCHGLVHLLSHLAQLSWVELDVAEDECISGVDGTGKASGEGIYRGNRTVVE